MNTIIDGYNYIFHFGWMKHSGHSGALEKSRQRMIADLAARIPAAERSEILIVYDAKRTPVKATQREQTINGFPVVFADHFDEADAMIEELIRTHSVPKTLNVVSNDHRLKDAARRRKAIAYGIEDWLDHLEAPPATRPSNQPHEGSQSGKEQAIKELQNTDWLAEFGFEVDEET